MDFSENKNPTKSDTIKKKGVRP